MEKVRLGIIGCGPIGTQVMYAPILKYLTNGEVYAVMDPNPNTVKYMQDNYGVPNGCDSVEDILGMKEIDAVIIVSPVQLHMEHTIKAAEAGKHVLCEKPMARTIDECDAMIDACNNHNVKLMVAFMKRFDKSFLHATKLIKEGELGEIIQVTCNWAWYLERVGMWRDKINTCGGVFQDHGSHTTNLCRWWLGEVVSVSGEVSIITEGREVEDQSVALLRHENGGISYHNMFRRSHKPLNEYYLIEGTKASLEIEHGPLWCYISTHPFTMKRYIKGKMVIDETLHNIRNIDEEIRTHGKYLRELEHFCDCIINDTTPKVTGKDGRIATEIINAVYLSSWKKEKINLPLEHSPDLERFFTEIRNQGIKSPV